ncbi:MAG TPA: porphobilinogen synthase [Chitinophagaceae bacterium]|nr:porphobilinogen synthase [Chitinophagaceae bacterium]HAN37885.1 porphobilinogen synthase [Chitinophagaceae bacterium]
MFLQRRNRILRTNAAIRSLVAETNVSANDFLVPFFIVEGTYVKEQIPSMPGYYRMSLENTVLHVKHLYSIGARAVLLFIKCADTEKDNTGAAALRVDGLMQKSIKAIKEAVPEILVFTDVALDPYSIYGHDGIVTNGLINNDATVAVLAAMAVSHAIAGADFVAPSDMMDGRVAAIRRALENHQQHHVGIMSYSAKYASCWYGPFRDALDSAPGFGDKKTYQMNPANRIEALKETSMDIQEGADIVMIKPALSYLDIIRDIKNKVNVPVAAYQVSGEYAMIKAAAAQGWVDEQAAMIESLLSIKRAGTDIIATYYAETYLKLLQA